VGFFVNISHTVHPITYQFHLAGHGIVADVAGMLSIFYFAKENFILLKGLSITSSFCIIRIQTTAQISSNKR
jgi:hypothetical protein